MTRQDRAQQVVDELVGRLTDPQEVAATTVRRAEAVSDPGARAQAWKADSLARGYPGLTVLWAELGVDDDASRRRAHRYLEAATVACRTEGFSGMFDRLGALAGATRVAGHQNGDYRSLATKVDAHAVSYAMHLIAVHRAARQAGRPTVSSVVDAMYGLAGVGRHLLHRPEHHATVRDTLSCLVFTGRNLRLAGAPRSRLVVRHQRDQRLRTGLPRRQCDVRSRRRHRGAGPGAGERCSGRRSEAGPGEHGRVPA